MMQGKIDWHNLNKIRCHNRNETMKHLVVKAMTAKILIDHKWAVYTEHPIRKGRESKVADVYAWKGKDKIVVELESRPTKKHSKELVDFYSESEDLVIIDLRKIATNLKKIEEQLLEILPL